MGATVFFCTTSTSCAFSTRVLTAPTSTSGMCLRISAGGTVSASSTTTSGSLLMASMAEEAAAGSTWEGSKTVSVL